MQAAAKERVTLNVFGPELPFMFKVKGGAKDFAWSDLIAQGDVGVGTISQGEGEVIGVGGAFYVADAANPKPRLVTNEMTPSGVVITFAPQKKLRLAGPLDLAGLQDALDKKFVDTETFVYVFKAHAMLSYVEYQLAGPRPTRQIKEGIESGKSQEAVTMGTSKYKASNIAATLVGVRAPAYLNMVFEIPYHIHFIADDKSILGHITALKAAGLEIEWARTDELKVRYWNGK